MAMTLQDKLRAKRFVITAEVTPPVTADRNELLAKALPLKGLADAVNITDGAGARPHLGAVTAAAMLVEAGIEPILQLTCRDRNRIALQSDLLSAAASGVRNLLMLRGDDPSAGDQPDAKPVFDLDPRQLLETARRLRDTGELPSGRKVSGNVDFFLGGADNPVDPKPGWAPTGLAAKIAAGAQFVQTQFCMDAGVVRRYVARLAEHGFAAKMSLHRRHRAAALGQVGALDQGKAVRRHHPRRARCAHGSGERSARRRPPHLPRAGARVGRHPAGRRRPHHGAGQRRGRAGDHQGGAREHHTSGAGLSRPSVRHHPALRKS